MTQQEYLKVQLLEARSVLDLFIENPNNMECIGKAAQAMSDSIKNGGKIISCGNGGSMCDAMHFAEELSGRFRDDRAPLAAISISDPSHLSCVGNDYGYNEVFARFVSGLGKAGDVLLAISTSGNSQNIIRAIEAAKEKGMLVVGLTGKDGGKMASLCDVEIRAPHTEYADHLPNCHVFKYRYSHRQTAPQYKLFC
jgi:D-sedoheptulose 7-phosphate isomerase